MTKFQLDAAHLMQPDGSGARLEEFVGALPDASGTFTGTFGPEVVADLIGPVLDLVPVEIDTGDQPNPAVDLLPGQLLFLDLTGEPWSFEVDHVEPLGSNRVRVWCHRPVHHSVE